MPPVQVTDITPSGTLAPVGRVVLVVVDVQGGGVPGAFEPTAPPGPPEPDGLPMPDRATRNAGVVDLVAACRERDVPVVFIQEVHKPSLVDIGRELDGDEGPHCVEGDPRTELHPGLDPRPGEYLIRKRRYSAFHGTELDLVLRGLGASTVLLVGGMTDVCVHYTAVDAHQLDYHLRVVTDLVAGSGASLHNAALRAMKYLQRDALVSSAAVRQWLAALPTPTTTVQEQA